MANLVFLDVNGRVALKLLELADRYGVECDGIRGEELCLSLTQAELATWVATSRESLNRVLKTLREKGLIEVVGHKILVLDRHGLSRYIVY
jgi:CRP-like cAMP-binding protein